MRKENPGRIFDGIQMIRTMIKKLIQDSDKSSSEEENTDWKLISSSIQKWYDLERWCGFLVIRILYWCKYNIITRRHTITLQTIQDKTQIISPKNINILDSGGMYGDNDNDKR